MGHNQTCFTSWELERRNTSLSLLAMLLFTRTPKPFSAELLSHWLDLSTYCHIGLLFPRCSTSHFHLLNILRFLSPISLKVSLKNSTTTWCIQHSSHLASSVKLLRTQSVPSFRTLKKMLISIGPPRPVLSVKTEAKKAE